LEWGKKVKKVKEWGGEACCYSLLGIVNHFFTPYVDCRQKKKPRFLGGALDTLCGSFCLSVR
jgi:hypothetical protein